MVLRTLEEIEADPSLGQARARDRAATRSVLVGFLAFADRLDRPDLEDRVLAVWDRLGCGGGL